MEANVVLIILLGISVLGKADSVSIAVAVLIIIRLLHVDNYIFPFISNNGTFWALVLLIAAMLIPIASGSITSIKIKNNLTSWIGIIALVLSFLTTYLSGVGLRYLTADGHGDVMPALILGSVVAASLLKGVPVGPFITSGILALVVKVFHKS